MALATYTALCIDAVDDRALGAFWADVLGLTPTVREDGQVRLDGPTPEHTVWINRVPEPVTVKQRTHLDVNVHRVEDVLALGATPVDLTSFRWKVLRDPEGGELCVFSESDLPDRRLVEYVVDAADPPALAAWWAQLIGGVARDDEQGRWSWIEQLSGTPFDHVVFMAVDDPKVVKNRIHLDVTTDRVEALVEAGARVLRPQDDEIGWSILADPEGNELCAFVRGG